MSCRATICVPTEVLRVRPEAFDGDVEKDEARLFRGDVLAAGEADVNVEAGRPRVLAGIGMLKSSVYRRQLAAFVSTWRG